jgi:hypothetical protein
MDDRIDDLIRDEARDYNEPPATPRDAMWERIVAARSGPDASLRSGEAAEAIGSRDASGDRIAAAPAGPRNDPRRRSLMPLFRLGIGIAALLALGIGIGRRMERPAAPGAAPAVATTPARPAAGGVDTARTPAVPEASDNGRELAAAPRTAGPRDLPVAPASRPERASRSGSAAVDMALGQHLGQSEAFLTLFRSSVRSGHVDPVAFAAARQLLSTNRLLLDSRAGADPRSRQLLQDLELVLAQIAQLGVAGDSSDVHIVTEDMDQGDVLPRLRTVVPAGI